MNCGLCGAEVTAWLYCCWCDRVTCSECESGKSPEVVARRWPPLFQHYRGEACMDCGER